MYKAKTAILMIPLLILMGCQITNKDQDVKIQNNNNTAENTVDKKIIVETTPIQTPESTQQSTNIINKIALSDQPPDNCNSPMGLLDTSSNDHHATMMEDGNESFWGDAYISAEISKKTEKNFKVQWYIGETDSNPQFQEDFNKVAPIDRYVTKWRLHSSQNVAPTKSCNEKLYLHITTPSLESGFGVTGTWLEPRKAVFLLGNEVVGEKSFYFQQ